jgi:hypothetical protein
MRLQQEEEEEDGIHMSWSHSKSQNTKWIVPCLCFHKNCTHKWTPPYVRYCEAMGRFFLRRRKKEERKKSKRQAPKVCI